MWHAAGIFSSIFLLLGPLISAQLYSEGGSNAWAGKQQEPLTNIVDELKALRNLQQQYEAEQLYAQQQPMESFEQAPQYLDSESEELGPNPQELAKIGEDLQKLLKEHEAEELNGQPEQQQPVQQPAKPEVDQQKRGQFEFVEFVEPHAKALKNVEYMDKRAPVSEISGPNHYLYYTSNNVMFIVAVTVCSVVVIAGVVGGAYHFNNMRKRREDAFDDFTRYSPAGPGRELRRGRGFAGSPVIESIDDSLAKQAHLHHYEQTKQKIIGSDGFNDDQSDKSDDEELEDNNFSIYECPGMSGSGDLEVKNPNFEHHHP
ncbi:Protein cab-1 [Aphelenchoides bicaudatus]|nr:Protein cab-1 [Aphelenchoides bicaudatus]